MILWTAFPCDALAASRTAEPQNPALTELHIEPVQNPQTWSIAIATSSAQKPEAASQNPSASNKLQAQIRKAIVHSGSNTISAQDFLAVAEVFETQWQNPGAMHSITSELGIQRLAVGTLDTPSNPGEDWILDLWLLDARGHLLDPSIHQAQSLHKLGQQAIAHILSAKIDTPSALPTEWNAQKKHTLEKEVATTLSMLGTHKRETLWQTNTESQTKTQEPLKPHAIDPRYKIENSFALQNRADLNASGQQTDNYANLEITRAYRCGRWTCASSLIESSVGLSPDDAVQEADESETVAQSP